MRVKTHPTETVVNKVIVFFEGSANPEIFVLNSIYHLQIMGHATDRKIMNINTI